MPSTPPVGAGLFLAAAVGLAHDRQRDLYRVSLEIDPVNWDAPRLELFTYRQGALVEQEWLAKCTVHGDTMEWRLPNQAR